MPRKIKYVLCALVLTTLTICACVFVEYYVNKSLKREITFNYESGFYEEPIEVELSVGDNYFLTYTLDGRAPNAASTKYEGPIWITDASENENVWSQMQETSFYYFNSSRNKIPTSNVDKCTILRVSAFDYEGNQINTDVREYFIGFDDKPGYSGMYNLCVSTDPENLFSADRGIYSAGVEWIKKIESCEIWDMDLNESTNKKANWEWNGRESERPVTIELFDENGVLLIREKCGARIAGSDSRSYVQKSLKFFARQEYSGSNYFTYDLFDEGQGPKTFMISDAGGDCEVKMVDYTIYSVLRSGNNGDKITPIIPCNLFLEGEYWGPMYIEKRVTCETIADTFGLEESNVVLIKSGEAKLDEDYADCIDSELADWEAFQRFIKNNDMSLEKNYDYVCHKMDVSDFAQYAAIEIYIGNSDWHRDNNYACWRTRKPEPGNTYSDGKWRFCLFDVNLSFDSDEAIWSQTYQDWDFYYMVKKLCENDEFKDIYKEEIENMKVLFAPDAVSVVVNEWSDIMEEPTRCYFRRFYSENADELIESEKERILSFCASRVTAIDRTNEWFFE